MSRQLFDRWADTRIFRFALLFAGLAVVPVLALGVLITATGGAALLSKPTSLDVEQVVFGLLSIGGVLGIVGYARAHFGAPKADCHNVTATLLCLAAGIVTAFAVVGIVVVGAAATVTAAPEPWSEHTWLGFPAAFVAANLVWAMSGIAWSQRLRRRYAEKVGRAFDTLPTLLLAVAAVLVTAAATITAAL